MESKKKTSDYSQGKIYKIICNKTGLIYIGSTCNTLEKRLKEHIGYYKAYIEKKKSNRLISSIFVTFNNDCRIELIESYPCNNKIELQKREYYYIDNIDCVNTHRISMDSKQYNIHREKMLKRLVDKCGKDAIINILFRYGIDEYIKNNKK
jgi:predicted GIY-YIG superfamily endonuclease